MRSFLDYDIIYFDLDRTLIYGWFCDLMDIVWSKTKNQKLIRFLMKIQAMFKLYKVNNKLAFILKKAIRKKAVVCVTARQYSPSNYQIIKDILGRDIYIETLGTDNPANDKFNFIYNYSYVNSKFLKSVLFEDNKDVIRETMKLDFLDVFDATTMYEKAIT